MDYVTAAAHIGSAVSHLSCLTCTSCLAPRDFFDTLHFSLWPRTEPIRRLSSEEVQVQRSSSECFDTFRLDLQWTVQASLKYQADCKILAPLLQGITWACLEASLKALNAFNPAVMPLFPGAGLSIKLTRKKMTWKKLGCSQSIFIYSSKVSFTYTDRYIHQVS